jgi:hypothetical protein
VTQQIIIIIIIIIIVVVVCLHRRMDGQKQMGWWRTALVALAVTYVVQ